VKQLAALEIALAELVSLVSSAPEAAADTEPLSREAALELLEKLALMLEQGDLGARQFSGDLRRIPDSKDLVEQIEDLDFHLALASLAGLKKSLGAR
jgi:hypothetical protein